MKSFFVVKSSGEREPYERKKVLNSLLNSGLSKKQAERVLKKAEKEFFDGISTSQIHNIIKEILKKQAFGFHTRYNLKKALFKLGPTGFPFERFVARILNEYGYKTKVDVVLQGACVQHEIDVVAVKEKKFRLVECKFHNSPGTKTDVKVPLYIKARFDDIIANPENENIEDGRIGSAWIFTNTKFTLDAISYSECQNIRITAWNYPRDLSIQKIIEKENLYPITVLEDIELETLKKALDNDIITVKDFEKNLEIAKEIFGSDFLKALLEVKALLEKD